jgi:hypothetical protein
MSVISTIFNQGTGLINPIGEGAALPIIVDDLVVNGNLTVLGTTQLIGDTAIDSNLTVSMTTTTEELVVNNNSILSSGVGSSNTALFLHPPTTGLNNQVLTVTDETTSPIETQWVDPTVVDDYVQYDLLTGKLLNNALAIVAPIDNITVDNSIGITGQRFKLPSNTTTATNNQVLAILNSAVNPKTTSWVTPTSIPQSIFISAVGSITQTNSNIIIVSTNPLIAGLYIVNYETEAINTIARTFTAFQTCVGFSANFSNPFPSLYTSSFSPINATPAPGTIRNAGCAVVSLTAVSTVLFVMVNNLFTGGNYLTNGSIRTTKIG